MLKKQAATDCASAATDDLAKLMATNGCNQVVRGTLKSGDGVYLITAGIFNLQDEPAAINSHENIKPTIDAQKGRFTGLLAGAGTEVLVRAPMILGWHARGHYLAYCVIARADGQGFDPADQVRTRRSRPTSSPRTCATASSAPAPSRSPAAPGRRHPAPSSS